MLKMFKNAIIVLFLLFSTIISSSGWTVGYIEDEFGDPMMNIPYIALSAIGNDQINSLIIYVLNNNRVILANETKGKTLNKSDTHVKMKTDSGEKYEFEIEERNSEKYALTVESSIEFIEAMSENKKSMLAIRYNETSDVSLVNIHNIGFFEAQLAADIKWSMK
ncbi:MAG: hypothetical protein ACRC42_01600 [Mycoplasma sp.]